MSKYILIINEESDKVMYKALTKIIEKDNDKNEYAYVNINNLCVPFTSFNFIDIIAPVKYIYKLSDYYRQYPCDIALIALSLDNEYKKEYDDEHIHIFACTPIKGNAPSNIHKVFGKGEYINTYAIEYKEYADIWKLIFKSHLIYKFNITYDIIAPEFVKAWYTQHLYQMRFRAVPHLNAIPNHYAKSRNKIMTENDFTYLGCGGFNIVIMDNTTNNVLRINRHRSEWNPEALSIIAKYNKSKCLTKIFDIIETGHIRYCIIERLKPIDNADKNKFDILMPRIKQFFKDNRDNTEVMFKFTDCWLENFMQTMDESEYILSDIDITEHMSDPWYDEELKNEITKHYDEAIANGENIKFNYNDDLYAYICHKHDIPVSPYMFTIIAFTLFELSGYINMGRITPEFESKLVESVKEWM